MLKLKIGTKPIKNYITACIVYFKNEEGSKDITILARGKVIGRAVDIAEILKRFTDPLLKVKKVTIGSVELASKPDKFTNKGSEIKTRMVSTMEIELREIKKK